MKNIINFIKKYGTLIILLCTACIIICQYRHAQKSLSENIKLRQNITALTDSVHNLTSKNGEYISMIQSYTGEISELKNYSDDLYNKLQDYKKSTGKIPVSAIHTETVTVLPMCDTIYILEQGEIEYIKEFDFSDKYRLLSGRMFVNDTVAGIEIDPEEIYADFTAGFDDSNNLFIMTDNPYIRIQNLHGFQKELSKKKHWGIGIQGGFGTSIDHFSFRPYIGIGISYNILTF